MCLSMLTIVPHAPSKVPTPSSTQQPPAFAPRGQASTPHKPFAAPPSPASDPPLLASDPPSPASDPPSPASDPPGTAPTTLTSPHLPHSYRHSHFLVSLAVSETAAVASPGPRHLHQYHHCFCQQSVGP
ncbi:hypothetical protein BKA57DRAFT_224712 [Linnemannia elongata]|nr:hypothetical protein BKA57DRAFT_224712 [Linnemannia elongata]